jgi:hypothetical protein
LNLIKMRQHISGFFRTFCGSFLQELFYHYTFQIHMFHVVECVVLFIICVIVSQ